VYLVQKPGGPRPLQPSVPTAEWPLNLNGLPEHPHKWTRYLYLLDTQTGTVSTFSTNTKGGHWACRDLTDQVGLMRGPRPGAVPIIALESKIMPTEFRKPRPHFKILGWRMRGDGGETVTLPAPERDGGPPVSEVVVEAKKQPRVTKIISDKPMKQPTIAEVLNDEIGF
jgi:hypothetical protein